MNEIKVPGSRNVKGDAWALGHLQKYYTEHKTFPTIKDLRSIDGDLHNKVYYIGGLNKALEFAIGTSPRLVVMDAIVALTSDGCSETSPGEILSELRSRGIEMKPIMLSTQLREMKWDRLVASYRIDRTQTWHLTPNGKNFLIETRREIKKFTKHAGLRSS